MASLAARTELQEFAADLFHKSDMDHRASDHALKANAKVLQASIDELEETEGVQSGVIEALHHDLQLAERKVEDLTYFANIEECANCTKLGHAPRLFSYTVSARSKNRGYMSLCRVCKKKHVRPE